MFDRWVILFLCCAGLVAYTYVVYPAVIWLCARLFGRPRRRPHVADANLPTVTLLIAAYNEESVIADRIENALATDYPNDRFRIVIASDGSADRTPEIVASYADRGVTLFDYKVRRGKSSVLNNAMQDIDSEIVLLSDANTHFDHQAVRKLVPWFADPAVGTVCGRLHLVDAATGRNADGLYWKYETFVKKCEAKLGALLGCNGAIYAIRRSHYQRIPSDTIVDDFVIPLLAKIRTGGEIIYDADAVATEESAHDVKGEFRRRARIGAGGFQAIPLLWRLLDPRRGWVCFSFLSHKVIRWLCPFFLVGMMNASFFTKNRSFSRYAILLQMAFYTLALLVSFMPRRLTFLKPLRLTHMFTSMNIALMFGFFRWARGKQKGTWDRTARSTGAGPAVGDGGEQETTADARPEPREPRPSVAGPDRADAEEDAAGMSGIDLPVEEPPEAVLVGEERGRTNRATAGDVGSDPKG